MKRLLLQILQGNGTNRTHTHRGERFIMRNWFHSYEEVPRSATCKLQTKGNQDCQRLENRQSQKTWEPLMSMPAQSRISHLKQAGRKQRGEIPPSSAFCSLQAFSGLDNVYPQQGGHLLSLTHLETLSQTHPEIFNVSTLWPSHTDYKLNTLSTPSINTFLWRTMDRKEIQLL